MRTTLFALVCSLCIHTLIPRGVCAQPTNWTLDDQFGRPHAASEWKGRTVLLIAGASPAAATFAAWGDAIVAAYGRGQTGGADSLPFLVVGLADIGNAPRVLHPLIRLRLPRNRARPVLVDYRGTVSRSLGVERLTSTQMVLGPDGQVLLHTRGVPVDTAQARVIAEALRRAVEQAARPAGQRSTP